MIPIEQELAAEIAEAVKRIVAASHAAAAKTLDEAFGLGQAKPSRSPIRSAGRTGISPPAAIARRSSEEIAELTQKLYVSICAQPGQTMVVLAKEVGSTPRALHLPVARLKTEGRVKAVGQRQWTCYFPLGTAPAPTS